MGRGGGGAGGIVDPPKEIVPMENSIKGAVVASAVASLLVGCLFSHDNKGAATPPTAGDQAAKIKCVGVNECKGKGQCAQSDHACGGKNECKGKGMTMTDTADCTSKGGKQL
jgi:hypothetical protein